MKNTLMICPNEEKIKLLQIETNNNDLVNIKYMTKQEFINNYYFSYNEDAIYYLMTKYNLNIDVAKLYLTNLYYIDENKLYKNTKLKYLQNLKIDLINNKLLIYNKAFINSLKNYNIIVKNYEDLEKYEEHILNKEFNLKLTKLNKDIYTFKTTEEEVNFVALKIIELINNNVDINKIYLNVSSSYYYILEKVFSYYNIPINIDYKYTIYSTKVVKDYLSTNELDLSDSNKNIINKKLINILKDLNNIDNTSLEYKEILIDRIRNSYLPNKKLVNAVNIKNIYNEEFNDDEYVFVLGFNNNYLDLKQDIDFISDKEKEEVELYTTNEVNKRRKIILSNVLNNIKNLIITYSNNSPFEVYYKSSLIDEYNLNEVEINIDKLNKSNKYNKIRLGEYLDNYYIYGEKTKELETLNSTYKIPYRTYSNRFNGIDNDTYLKNIAYPLNLSYTSLNTYNECKFKYYVKYVLRLDPYEDIFASFIGSMYHEILSLYTKSNFNFEEVYNEYLEKRDLSLKEKLLLIKIKEDLLLLIDKLNEQRKLTNFNEEIYEKKLEVPLNKEIKVNIIGYIDKIMYYKNIEDMYFTIIDYKTGTIDTHIEPMKYGLHMQLPVYLYLIHYSKAFTSPIFTGIYYQNILFNYPKYSNNYLKEEETKYYLQGYSTNKIDILEKFDKSFEDSKLIKSMKYNDDKFSSYTKIINDEEVYNLVKYTKEIINNNVDDIIKGDFSINPKVYNNKNVSCEYCKYKDLCYKTDDDITYLDKVEDLSFLTGGDL